MLSVEAAAALVAQQNNNVNNSISNSSNSDDGAVASPSIATQVQPMIAMLEVPDHSNITTTAGLHDSSLQSPPVSVVAPPLLGPFTLSFSFFHG